jgi:hypothetical protein
VVPEIRDKLMYDIASVTVYVRGWVNPRDTERLEGLGKWKKSNNFIGIRTRNFPACSAVSQPTTPPSALSILILSTHLSSGLPSK